MLDYKKNLHQTQQKSLITSLTGTSVHQLMNKRNSLSVKQKNKNNLSEKSLDGHLLSGMRNSTSGSRQKILSRRYTTLTAGQEVKRRQTKKSKSFSNRIYFPHTKFFQIDEKKQQNQNKNIIKLKNRSQGGLQKLQTSLNIVSKQNQKIKPNVIVHKTQFQNNEVEEISFLAKLNLQKRNKIMQIYRPKVKEVTKSRKNKRLSSQKLHQSKSTNQSKTVQSDKEKQVQTTVYTVKEEPFQTKIFDIKSESITQKEEKKSIKKAESFRPNLITHLIIDNKQSSKQLINHQKRKIGKSKQKFNPALFKPIKQQPRDEGTPAVINSKNQIIQVESKIQHRNEESSKFCLPKYTQFYDSYVSQQNFKNKNLSQKAMNLPQKRQFLSKEVQTLIHNRPTPTIKKVKANSITPRVMNQPYSVINKTQQMQSLASQNENLVKQECLKRIQNEINRARSCTPKLKIINDFLTQNFSNKNSSFKILKINQGTYFGELDSQMQYPHGLGVIFYTSGKLFEGQFINGQKNGQGFQIYPDGSFFLGYFVKNKKNGKGRFQWFNGQVYDGEWVNDRKHGSGQWIADNTISYVGEWKDNKIQGFGVLIEGDERYEGEFINFSKYGHGTYRYENGQLYTGQFKNNRLNGDGEYFWPNGDHYKGSFVNNKRHGSGILHLSAQNITYRGQFRNDKKCGYGQQTYHQRVKYIGNFQNDFKHGWGILKRLYPDEENHEQIIYQGYWVNNQTIEMSQTPIDQFQMIQQEEGEYMRNDLSRSNLKVIEPKKKPSPQKKKPLYMYQAQPKLKPKQSITLKGRSRYMRINNHYIQKSIQGSNAQSSSNLKSLQRLEKSKSPQLNRDLSSQSIGKQYKRQCQCGQHK